jgi:hypothetical protein
MSTSLADLAQAVLFVADFTNRCPAFDVNATDLAGAQTHLRIGAFTSQQLDRRTRRTCNLSALSRHHFDAMNRGTDRNIADRQRVTRLDRRLGTTKDFLPDTMPLVAMM